MKKILATQQHEQEIAVKQIATPSNPPSGYVFIYAKADKKIYQKDSLGVETLLGGSGGGGDPTVFSYTTITADTTLSTEQMVFIDASAGNVTATLPSPVGLEGKTFKVAGDSGSYVAKLAGSLNGHGDIIFTSSMWQVEVVSIGGAWAITSYQTDRFPEDFLGTNNINDLTNVANAVLGIDASALNLRTNGHTGGAGTNLTARGIFFETTDPTDTHDSANGYEVNDIMFNKTNGKIFRCIDSTDNAAVWENLISQQETLAIAYAVAL